MKKIKHLFFIGFILFIGSQELLGQATYGSVKLTANYDQLKFEIPGENRYWFMSKPSVGKSYALYSPDEGGYFTYWKIGSGDMIINKGKIGLGTSSPDQMLSIYNPNSFNINMEAQNQDHISLKSKVHGINNYFGGITWKVGSRRRASVAAVQEHTDSDHIGLAFFTKGMDGAGPIGESIRISRDGNLGIGTKKPSQLLTIKNPNSFNINMQDQQQDHISLESSSNGIDTYFGGITWKSGARRRASISAIQEQTDADHIGIAFFTKGTDGAGPIGESMRISRNGELGIGTTDPKAKLHVNGNILASEVKVSAEASQVPDYVFEPDYKLISLSDVEEYVKKHKHLPEVPSAQEVEAEGLELAKMNLLLLKKIEELTLYLIEEKNDKEAIMKELISLKKEVEILKQKNE